MAPLSSRSAGNLRTGSLIVPFLLNASPKKNTHVCVQGLRITVLSVLAEFQLAFGMPGTLRKLGRAQQSDLTFLFMLESDEGSEGVCALERGRDGISEKEKGREAYGWMDRQREA